MRKIIILGMASLFLLTSFNCNINAGEQNVCHKIVTAYSFKSPMISKVNINNTIYDSISIDGAPCSGNPGKPSLPAKGAYILIPQGKTVSGISVSHGEVISLGSGFLVEPMGQAVPLSDA